MDVLRRSEMDDFLNYLKFEKRYSLNTVLAYRDDLTQFYEFLDISYGSLPLNEITSGLVRTWLASLKENTLKNHYKKNFSIKILLQILCQGRVDRTDSNGNGYIAETQQETTCFR